MLVNRMYSVNYLLVRYWEKNEKTAEDRIGSKRARIPSILSIVIHSVIVQNALKVVLSPC